MGNDNDKNSKKKQVNISYIKFSHIQLPPKLDEKVRKLFSLIDVDGSETIDREETLRFWSSNFAKINSKVLFDQVDKMIKGGSWVKFETNKKLGDDKNKKLKAKGKW